MPDNDFFEQILAEKQQQFREANDIGDLDEAYEINQEIQEIMMAMYS